MIKHIIFDLDGTLADTAADILNCLRQAYSQAGLKPSKKLNKYFIGPPIGEIIKKLNPRVTGEQLKILTANYRRCYYTSAYPKTKLNSDAKLVLKRLKSLGLDCFLATNKPIIPTLRILKKFGLTSYFLFIAAPDPAVKPSKTKPELVAGIIKKFHLAPAQALMVGDGASDIRAARQNRLKAAVLINGYGKKADLLALKPEYYLPRLKNLLKLIL